MRTSHRWIASSLAAAATVFASVTMFGAGGRDALDGAGAGGPDAAPGVVLICLDTLRADSLSLDSGRPVRMPRLEAFAKESVAFADAQSAAAWTVPSVASLLSGLEPDHTGVYGLPERIQPMPDAVPTLAKSLSAAGWFTAAISSSGWTGPDATGRLGFHEGLLGLDRNPEAVLTAWNRRRPQGRPFLLFLHSLAAHEPYLDKDRDARTPPDVASASVAGRLAGFDAVDLARLRQIEALVDAGTAPAFDDLAWMYQLRVASSASHAGLFDELTRLPKSRRRSLFGAVQRWLDDGCERDPRTRAVGDAMRRIYDHGLASVDRMFGRLMHGLEQLALPKGTLFVVVGDHGEAFGEHMTLNHGRRLFDEVLRVPLLVQASGRMGAARVVHGPVGLVDVTPTILAWAGRPATGLDGVSLLDAGAGPLPDRALRSVEERQTFDERGAHAVRLTSIRTARARCIVRRDAVDDTLLGADVYDLAVDPWEQHPIPYGVIEQPAEFGEAFADAWNELQLARPGAEESAPLPAASNPQRGG